MPPPRDPASIRYRTMSSFRWADPETPARIAELARATGLSAREAVEDAITYRHEEVTRAKPGPAGPEPGATRASTGRGRGP